MKLSHLIKILMTAKKLESTGFDPEVRIIGRKLDQGIFAIGALDDFIVIHLDEDSYVSCKKCGQASEKLCGCDK